MNREMYRFSKTYMMHGKTTKTWYTNFLSNTLYKTYYTFLDKIFTKYNYTFKKACTKDLKKYRALKKTWNKYDKTHYHRAS